MTWLAWRQLRTPAAVAALGVLGVLVALTLTGPHLVNIYDSVVLPCAAHGDCSAVTAHFQGLDSQLVHLCSALMILAPVLFGIFLGAPLISRELEAGTYRLAWTQSVTRTRWIATRLALVTLVTAVLMALLTSAVTWWQRPLDLVNGPIWSNFDQRDVVPVAFAVFAVALGAFLGAITHRMLVAMAGTFAGYFGVHYLVWAYVRRNLFAPLRASLPFHLQLTSTGVSATIGPPQLNDLPVSNQIVTGTGRVVGQDGVIGPNGNLGVSNVKANGTAAVFTGVGRCPNRIPVSNGPHWHTIPATQAALQRCVDSFHLREVIAYQPGSRYWPLQWSEAAIFVALALALSAGCVWWVRRRLP
jgi:hypothetical protein